MANVDVARARLISPLAPVPVPSAFSSPRQKIPNQNQNPCIKYTRFDNRKEDEERSVRLFHDLQMYLRHQTKIWPHDLVGGQDSIVVTESV